MLGFVTIYHYYLTRVTEHVLLHVYQQIMQLEDSHRSDNVLSYPILFFATWNRKSLFITVRKLLSVVGHDLKKELQLLFSSR